MGSIVNIYRESLPALRLIGRKYGDGDRNALGTFGHKWGEWFEKGRFAPLEALPLDGPEPGAYLGFMQMTPAGVEYWIGLFCKPGTEPPEGYGFLDISPAQIGVCWVKGDESKGEIYGQEQACTEALAGQGMRPVMRCFERYQCPRYTTPDANGDVILDLCFFLEDTD